MLVRRNGRRRPFKISNAEITGSNSGLQRSLLTAGARSPCHVCPGVRDAHQSNICGSGQAKAAGPKALPSSTLTSGPSSAHDRDPDRNDVPRHSAVQQLRRHAKVPRARWSIRETACCAGSDRSAHKIRRRTTPRGWAGTLALVAVALSCVLCVLMDRRSCAAATTPPGEVAALLALWNATGNSSNLNWGVNDPCGNAWTGVTCSTGPPVAVT